MKELLVQEIVDMGIKDQRVVEAIKKIPRENFVEEKYKKYAYGNYPLPIPEGQTISQPYTVAFMLELMELKKGEKILEIGAGSGYNAAVMSDVVGEDGEIISIEINDKLVEFANNNLKKTGIKNVKIIKGDGSKGYENGAPYDKIIITADCPHMPEKLFEQLKDGGIMVLPLKSIMTKITKKGKEKIIREYGGFSFVPLRGKYGYRV